jgi:hypothetical protein
VAKCTNGSYVAPATGAAASCGNANAPADGARMQLKMTDAQVAALAVPSWEKIVLEAMIHYGVFVTDTGGNPMDLQFEPALDYTSFGYANPLMSYLAGQGLADPATLTISLPWSDFQVVSSCYARNAC